LERRDQLREVCTSYRAQTAVNLFVFLCVGLRASR